MWKGNFTQKLFGWTDHKTTKKRKNGKNKAQLAQEKNIEKADRLSDDGEEEHNKRKMKMRKKKNIKSKKNEKEKDEIKEEQP